MVKSPPPSTQWGALFYAPNDVRYEQTPIPTLEPGELLVQIHTALTCGTDLKSYRRGHPVLLNPLPSPFGHEFSGIVAQIGSVDPRLQPERESRTTEQAFSSCPTPTYQQPQVGDQVVVANSAPCYNCFYCSKGQTNLCERLKFLNGAYAEYIRVPAQIASYNTYLLPDDLSFEIAAFCEPLAVCLHGLAQSDIHPGDHVAVMGLGPIGQLMVCAAKLMGAHVTAIARNPEKLKVSQSFGHADAIVDLSQTADPSQICLNHTPGGRGFDRVIEAIGLPQTWEKAIALVRKGGLVNLFGGCASGSSISIDTRRLHYDEIRLVSSFHHTPYHFKAALDLLSLGKIDPRPLISAYWPMARFEEALQHVEAGQAVKIALQNQVL